MRGGDAVDHLADALEAVDEGDRGVFRDDLGHRGSDVVGPLVVAERIESRRADLLEASQPFIIQAGPLAFALGFELGFAFSAISALRA